MNYLRIKTIIGGSINYNLNSAFLFIEFFEDYYIMIK